MEGCFFQHPKDYKNTTKVFIFSFFEIATEAFKHPLTGTVPPARSSIF